MSVQIKPMIDAANDRDIGFTGYDGPPPEPGFYTGKLTRMGVMHIASGENQGAQRIPLVVEISEGKFKGAGIYHNLNVTVQGAPFVNLFLDALTDGTEKQRSVLQDWFWHHPWKCTDDPMGKLGNQFEKIGPAGKKGFIPIGRTVKFVTRMGFDQNGEPRAEIAKFLTPSEQPPELSDDEISDGIGEFAAPTTMNPEPEPEIVPEPVVQQPVSSSGAEIVDLDDDDPWT